MFLTRYALRGWHLQGVARHQIESELGRETHHGEYLAKATTPAVANAPASAPAFNPGTVQ